MHSHLHKLQSVNCTIDYKPGTILTGQRDPDSNLWLIDFPDQQDDIAAFKQPVEVALAVNDNHKPAEIVKFAHAALFLPSISTLKKALDRNYIVNFPGLTAQTLRRHPPSSVATIKGHIDQLRKTNG